MTIHYDLIIVGGGLVGAGLAAALQDSSWKIALIDAREPSNNDQRLFALNHSSCEFLQNVGVWSVLKAHTTPIQQVHVSRRGHFGAVRLHASDVNLASLGHVIPAYQIEKALNEKLATLTNVAVYRPALLKQLTQTNDAVTLTIATKTNEEQILHAAFVMGADGTDSTVRQQLSLTTKCIDYQQTALVAHITLQRSHQHIAYERFNDKDAIAMLPLPNNQCAMIWSGEQSDIAHLMQQSDADFLQTLQRSFGYRLGRLQAVGKRFHYPLRMVTTEKNAAGRVLLLGNSAHTLHPIAAQGLNLALYEVAALVEKIQSNQLDLNQLSNELQTQQAASMRLSHHLAEFIANDSPLASCFVQLGMLGLDTLRPLKKQFITRMIGKAGRVPRLLLSAK